MPAYGSADDGHLQIRPEAAAGAGFGDGGESLPGSADFSLSKGLDLPSSALDIFSNEEVRDGQGPRNEFVEAPMPVEDDVCLPEPNASVNVVLDQDRDLDVQDLDHDARAEADVDMTDDAERAEANAGLVEENKEERVDADADADMGDEEERAEAAAVLAPGGIGRVTDLDMGDLETRIQAPSGFPVGIKVITAAAASSATETTPQAPAASVQENCDVEQNQGKNKSRECATPGEYELQLPLVALDRRAVVQCGVVVCNVGSRAVRRSRLCPPTASTQRLSLQVLCLL